MAGFDATALFQIIFYVMVLFFVIHATIFAYHWNAFGADKKRSRLGIAIHFLVGAVFLTIMAIALMYI